MKVIQVLPSIVSEASGTASAVPSLCCALSRNGVDVRLHVMGDVLPWHSPCETVCHPRKTLWNIRGIEWSSPMLRALRHECKTAEVIHSNGLWMMPNVYPYWASSGTGCKLVIQPHGTLSPWALGNSKWKKRLFGWAMQYAAMRHADMWVATAEEEYDDIRRLGYRQPVCILPNGIDLPEADKVRSLKTTMPPRRRMYFLSRIHPKKNVDLLLRVWSRLEQKFPEWDLSIVGPDKGNPYAEEMKKLAKKLGCARVTFEGEINGEDKLRFVAQSECIVLPTHSENFGMVIAEALACGTAAICSHGAPWEGLNRERCGWWVPTTEDAFEQAMSEAMTKSREELKEMGERGRDWMCRDFSWDGIGVKMKAAYEWLCHGGQCPEWVRVGDC